VGSFSAIFMKTSDSKGVNCLENVMIVNHIFIENYPGQKDQVKEDVIITIR